MGTYLSQPNLEKDLIEGISSNQKLSYWISEMQGWRATMEDNTIHYPNFDDNIALFGIFDGHGGNEASMFVKENFAIELKINKYYIKKQYIKALEETFLKMDSLMHNENNIQSGCTAIVALFCNQTLYVANSGDCRSLLLKTNGEIFVMNKEHKPEDKKEMERIINSGGVVLNGRVNEILNLTRALGDLTYKQNPFNNPKTQIISGFPDVVEKSIDQEYVFLLIGCDGVFESLTDFEIRDLLLDDLIDEINESVIINNLLDKCIYKGNKPGGPGCDNMSAILIKLNY